MLQEKITIINKLGLHARAAAKLVTLATGFQSEVNIAFNGKQVNGKSIMGVMMLAAAKGSNIEISVSGKDESEAMSALLSLINNRFDEEQ
ncbi:MAG: HPr family phosphocarrier protein [Gammaproteobacteria bacterium]|nr:HPr family phosphocarrier protein [Gammaproteobacteria bacterium]MDH5653653.1 HPr family phosphocarrier protein [Gammaproteobacteria bacterium]